MFAAPAALPIPVTKENVLPSYDARTLTSLDKLLGAGSRTMTNVPLQPFGPPMSILAQPSIVHFPHFALQKSYRFKISLLNRSAGRVRTQIVPPSSAHFSVQYEKKGSIVPGQTETILLEFTPREWRYYYDCIRVRTSNDEMIVIPIHCYPVMNDVVFPTKISFGACPISETQTKIIPLQCKVPIDFEFELTVTEPHSFFTVFPIKGIVPGNGRIDIAITFTPLSHITAVTRLEINIAQFGFTPFVCEIYGSSYPGLVREIVWEEERERERIREETKNIREEHESKDIRREEEGMGNGEGSNRGSSEELVEEVEMEEKVKDVDVSEGSERELLEENNLRVPVAKNLPKDREYDPAHFESEIIQKARSERFKEVHHFVCIGENLPSDTDLEALMAYRRQQETQTQGESAKPMYTAVSSNLSHPIAELIRTRRVDRPTNDVPISGKSGPAITASGASAAAEWARRARSLKRFVQAGRAVVVRNRAKKRIGMIKRFLDKTGYNRGAVPNGTLDDALDQYFGPRGPTEEEISANRLMEAFRTAVNSLEKRMVPDVCELPKLITPGIIDWSMTSLPVEPPEAVAFPAHKPLDLPSRPAINSYTLVGGGGGNKFVDMMSPTEFLFSEPVRVPFRAPDNELDEFFPEKSTEGLPFATEFTHVDSIAPPQYPPGHIYNPTPSFAFFYNPSRTFTETDPEYSYLPSIRIPNEGYREKGEELYDAGLDRTLAMQEVLASCKEKEEGWYDDSGYRGTETDSTHLSAILPFVPKPDGVPPRFKEDGTSSNLLYSIPLVNTAKAFIENTAPSAPRGGSTGV